MANDVKFHLTVNNETAVTRNWQGRTLRQLFENAMSRGLIGQHPLTNVSVNVNNRQLGGLETVADTLVSQLDTADIYVTLVATTGTKQ